MSGIAEILLDQGFNVSGSDRALSDVTERLLGVVGETKDCGVTIDPNPVVLPVVLEVFGVH